MADNPKVPRDYVRLAGSTRGRSPKSDLIGDADPKGTVSFTIVLRRRPDGPPLPDSDYWLKTPGSRKTYDMAEFARLYGALPEELQAVEKFVTQSGMKILESNAARRTVIVEGTVSQVNSAFAVVLREYSSPLPTKGKEPMQGREGPARPARPQPKQVHRSYEGDLHVPGNLAKVVLGVLGLDNRKVTGRNISANYDQILVTAPEVCQLYGWPIGPVPGQTIGIMSEGG